MRCRRCILRSLLLVLPATGFACSGDNLVEPATGTLQVITSTIGLDPDPDGYFFVLDATEPGRPIGTSGSENLTGVESGSHTIDLAGVASNCSVDEGTARTIVVIGGKTTEVRFTITCSPNSGSLRVSVSTTGSSPDPDGYLVELDGVAGQSVESTGEIAIENLAPGSHSVGLSGVATNCEIEGDSPRTAEVTAGSSAQVVFAVTCAGPSGTWARRAPMPTPRAGLAGAVIRNAAGQDILYAIGGTNWLTQFTEVEAYNLATDTWISKAPLPYGLAGVTASVIAGRIYVVGGSTLNIYTPETDTWTQKENVPVIMSGGITAVIGQQLYVLARCTGCSSQRFYRYDPVTEAWTRLANPINDHREGTGAAIDGRFYVAWGWSSTVDMYDPVSDSWIVKLTMTEFGDVNDWGGLMGSAGVSFDEKLYVIGGRNDDNAESVTLAYDPVSNTWEHKASMGNSREYPAAGVVKNAAGQLQIVVTGGFSTDVDVDQETGTEVYTP